MFRVPKVVEKVFGNRLGQAFQGLTNKIRFGKVPVESTLREFAFTKETDSFIDKAIAKMIEEQRVGSGRSWKEMALKKPSVGKQINNYIKNELKESVGQRVRELVSDNSRYIKTLPTEWAEYASRQAAKMTINGKSPEEIEEELRKNIPEHMQKNLKTIARTEASKANSAIAQARAEDIGIPCYFWRTCKDEKVRPSHRKMEGVVCFWNDPPAPEGREFYHPGGTYNDRCYAEPIINYNDLPNHMRVWMYGGIRRISKKSFIRLEKEQRRSM